MSLETLVNGRSSSSITINDRGLAYGDGLFETIKISQGHPQFLSLHLQRLQLGCSRLGIHCDVQNIESDIAKVLSSAVGESAILKIIVTRESTGRGYRPEPSAGSNRFVMLEMLANDYTASQTEGVAVRVCDTRLGINPQLAGIKHLSRLENVMARSEWSDSAITEGLMSDTDGRIVEGTMSNVFIVNNKKLITPSLHRCGVEGVMRQVVINCLAPSLTLSCEIADLTMDDFYQAQEIFLCNSLMGLVPVVSIGCHTKTIGGVTQSLQQALLQESSAHA